MEEKKSTRYKRSPNLHVRTVGFPPELYERIVEIAKREDRDVTAQIIRMLRQSLEAKKSPADSQPEAVAA